MEGTYGLIQAEQQCVTDPWQVDSVDLVLLSTKSHDTESAGPWLKALCKPGTQVAVLQNGVDHEYRVAPLSNPGLVVPTGGFTL